MLRDLSAGAPGFKLFLQFSRPTPGMRWARLRLEHSIAGGLVTVGQRSWCVSHLIMDLNTQHGSNLAVLLT